MRLPIINPQAIPVTPTTELEVQRERAYCDELAQRLLEYELNPRNFLKKMRLRAAVRGFPSNLVR